MRLEPAVTPHLTDCFAGLMAYVVSFRQSASEKQPAYEDVRRDILRLLKDSESFVTQDHCTPDDYDLARYAVCAWIDETVLASAWNFKARWRPDLLQRAYYQSADAGEKFFQKLKGLEARQQSVREVYTLCLALGFKGRYCAPDDSYALDQLKERHLKWLFNSVTDVPSMAALEKNRLFPEAYTQQPAAPRAKHGFRLGGPQILMASPVALAAALFLMYWLTLYNVGDNILKAVRS